MVHGYEHASKGMARPRRGSRGAIPRNFLVLAASAALPEGPGSARKAPAQHPDSFCWDCDAPAPISRGWRVGSLQPCWTMLDGVSLCSGTRCCRWYQRGWPWVVRASAATVKEEIVVDMPRADPEPTLAHDPVHGLRTSQSPSLPQPRQMGLGEWENAGLGGTEGGR